MNTMTIGRSILPLRPIIIAKRDMKLNECVQHGLEMTQIGETARAKNERRVPRIVQSCERWSVRQLD